MQFAGDPHAQAALWCLREAPSFWQELLCISKCDAAVAFVRSNRAVSVFNSGYSWNRF